MTIKVEKISNGTTICCDTMKHFQSVSLKILILVGSRDEKLIYDSINAEFGNTGISHFMEHMAFKGTNKINKKSIAISLDRLGGSYNAYTSKEYTAFTCKVPRIYFEEAFAIFAEIIQNSTFDEDEIKTEREVILQEMAMTNDDPSDIIFDKLYEISYKDDIFGQSILGSIKDLVNLKRSDFLDFARSYYHNNNIIIGAAGNISFEDLEALSLKFFNNSDNLYSESKKDQIIKDKSLLKKPIFHGGSFYEKRDIEQAHIVLGFEGFEKKHSKYFTSQVALSVLGGGMSSRLFQKIREDMGLVYSISAWNIGYFDTGISGIYAATSPEKIKIIIDEIHKQIIKLISDFSEEELESMKKQVRCGVLMQTDGTNSRINHMTSSIFHFDKYISGEELIDMIDVIKINDAKELLFDVFFKHNKSLAIISNSDDQNIFDEFNKAWIF